MTIGEVIDPVALPIALAVAVLSVLWLVWHVARRYRSAPKRIPMGIRIDGRPRRFGPKAMVWAAPAAVAIALGVAGASMLMHPPRSDQRFLVALVVLLIAELAWFAGWIIDRQIELARKMTYRVAPSRTLRALLPVILTVIMIVVVSVHP